MRASRASSPGAKVCRGMWAFDAASQCPPSRGSSDQISLDDWALKQVKADLMAGGHRVTGVARLRDRKGEPSKAVKVTFESCTLPAEVWVASTPYQVAACAASVRRRTKC